MNRDNHPQVIILCEDDKHYYFARRYLMLKGFNPQRFIKHRSPDGRGSGEQWVRENYPIELKNLRSLTARSALVVITDCDGMSCDERKGSIEKQESRRSGEKVLIITPDRNIESWFAWLDEKSVFDGHGKPVLVKDKHGQKKKCDFKQEYKGTGTKLYAKKMKERCDSEPIDNLPESIKAACEELQRIN